MIAKRAYNLRQEIKQAKTPRSYASIPCLIGSGGILEAFLPSKFGPPENISRQTHIRLIFLLSLALLSCRCFS